MKKFLSIFAIAFIAIGLIGCNTTEEQTTEGPMTAPAADSITMANVDEYLFNEEFQFVDLRNFDDQMSDGWVRGFEFIPFFDYLEYTEVLVRTDTDWSFAEEDIMDESSLRALFDEDKFIVLMCASGTRAGFVKDALDHLGYEHVYNAGGLGQYTGDNKVFGDGTFNIDMPNPVLTDPLPELINMADENIDLILSRTDVQFIDLRNLEDIIVDGWHNGATVIPFFTFLEANNILVRTDGDFIFAEEDIIDEAALRAIFCEDQNIIIICKSGTRAGYVKDALEFLGYENVWNAGGYSDYAGADDTNNGGCE